MPGGGKVATAASGRGRERLCGGEWEWKEARMGDAPRLTLSPMPDKLLPRLLRKLSGPYRNRWRLREVLRTPVWRYYYDTVRGPIGSNQIGTIIIIQVSSQLIG